MSGTFSGQPDTSRPATSRPQVSDEAEPTPKTSSENIAVEATFVPNVFDLVYMGRRAQLSVVRPAMQLYLGAQAIDQSKFLGQGASFEVYSKQVPRSEGFVFETRILGTISGTRQGQHDERTLVYKTARITFSNLGEPLAKDRRAMNAVMVEIHALMHPPLYEHANIVTLLALGWGTNPFESSYRLPVIVTEYADQGNLADLQPSVQTFLFERFRARADEFASHNQVNTPEVTGKELATIISPQQILERQAFSGSRGALQDLAIIAPERAVEAKRIIKAGLAGVGASFWGDDLLHGYTHAQWINTFCNTTSLVENLRNLREIADYKVNRRGDRILHMAASCGHLPAVEALLDNFPSLIADQLNNVGETPLLSACRSGPRDVVELLLSRGANPKITTSSKESPLHWLISFNEDEVYAVGQALISAGADVKSLTTKQINYSAFPSGIDFDNLPPGTPLTWAVHHDRPDIIKFLLSQPESAHLCVINAPNDPTPLDWAAKYHHRHCLEAMIVAMKAQRVNFTYQEFLKAAVHGADMFSMIFRSGVQYLERMKDTLDYLLEETHGASFGTGLGGFGYTLLYYAISEGRDLVVKYLLAPETEALLRAGRERLRTVVDDEDDMPIPRYGVFSEEHINNPCGIELRTPLLECIRWNHHEIFDLLIARGADVHARSRNPFDGGKTNWSALHAFAYAGHDSDLTLVRKIVEAGVDVYAQLNEFADLETPFLVSLKSNALNLARELLLRGANINAACISSGFITLEQPTTILGHLIASAARGSIARMQLIFNQAQAAQDRAAIFIVEPQR
ncbi:hypothetical protein BTUL_0113g00170 [Botrytis tulipae]|uniref:Uncharacterized protein n=1 Tax=Botrytis tulipae TaxID=87230 RepID=A0A4Z1EQJ3_9HELO|nr:hypothetical protein BTUL_0113g00170 [Botrytis tulipae]